jgi:hypothetical protein
MTGVTSGAVTANPSGAPEFTPTISGVHVTRSLVLWTKSIATNMADVIDVNRTINK